ncbi:MAG TPA: MFS transporter [Ktedonobacteraceae bacterium]
MQTAQKVSLWRNRDFLLLMSGQTISSVGSGISDIAAPLLILYLTHSPVQTGLAYALETLPFLLLSLLAGALVDRWDRKRVMIVCDIARALNLVTLFLAFFTGHLTLAQIYLNAFIEGVFTVFFSSAETAVISQVVTRPQLAAGYATDQVLANSASLIGPALGGLLYGLAQALPFVVDAASYVASFVALACMKQPFQQVRTEARRRLLSEIGAGVSYLWRSPVFRFMAFYGAVLLGVLS